MALLRAFGKASRRSLRHYHQDYDCSRPAMVLKIYTVLFKMMPRLTHIPQLCVATRSRLIWLNFGWQFWRVQDTLWIRPAHCLLMLFQFQAFKIRTKIQPNLVEFWVTALAGPRRFLDEISLQNSHKNSAKFGSILVGNFGRSRTL